MEQEKGKLPVKKIAVIAVFAPLYALFNVWPFFPVIGASGKFITLAVVMAPLIGIFLGARLGTLTVIIGGIVGLSLGQTSGPFGPISFVPHATSALFSGMLCNSKRITCSIAYTILLTIFALYPMIGPAWSHPFFLWMHLIGLVILLSPIQVKAFKHVHNYAESTKLVFAIGTICLTSTLFSSIVGNIMFEVIYWPTLIPILDEWKTMWLLLAWVYPIERTIIAITAALIGTALLKIFKASNLKL
jgi:hypothetical protein